MTSGTPIVKAEIRFDGQKSVVIPQRSIDGLILCITHLNQQLISTNFAKTQTQILGTFWVQIKIYFT